MSERQSSIEVPKPHELLDALFDIPGSTGETYSRLYPYSVRNLGFLAMQGCPPLPVGTYAKWASLGFHVKKGEKAYSILRPINVRVEAKNEEEEDRLIRRFKVVRALFHYGQVAGEGELPPYEPQDWSLDRALDELDIEQVPFESYDGNIGGYAVGRTIAINPLTPNKLRTGIHEVSHVTGGHTTPENLAIYQQHRGVFEFEAEASAFVVLKEIGALDEATATVSRGYVQHWRQNRPPEEHARHALNIATTVLSAGYEKKQAEVIAA